jgi:hypothetical protein
MFFFEKKNQKTFIRAVADLSGESPTGNEGFLVRLFEEERAACLP